jgi:RND family efflux transporter MFP subunit
VGEPGGSIPVTVGQVQVGDMEQTLSVTGSLVALQDVQVSAKATGKVTLVTKHEGDPVSTGELLVQQYAGDLEANAQQAEADVISNEAKLQEADVNYKIGVVQAQQSVLQAKASVAQAHDSYVKEKGGSRPQEILEAQDTLDSAGANRDNALVTLNRNKALYAEGAIDKADLDTAQTTYDVDVAQYNNAKEALDLAVIGNRQEDIASSAAQVRQQETTLRTNLVNLKTVELRKDDIIAAQAALDQSKATLAFDQEQVAYASITSPIDGVVAARSTEPGQEATPGTVLMRIVNLRSVYYEPTVSETDIASIHIGEPVQVHMDALSGQVFPGRVTEIYPAAASAERTFNLRVAIDNPNDLLRPGMFARGAVVIAVHRHVPIVPAGALVADATGQGFQPNTSSDEMVSNASLTPPSHVVVVGPDGKAVIRHVTVGIADMNNAEITSGLRPGETIVVVGQNGLRDGDKLAVVNGAGAKAAQESSGAVHVSEL